MKIRRFNWNIQQVNKKQIKNSSFIRTHSMHLKACPLCGVSMNQWLAYFVARAWVRDLPRFGSAGLTRGVSTSFRKNSTAAVTSSLMTAGMFIEKVRELFTELWCCRVFDEESGGCIIQGSGRCREIRDLLICGSSTILAQGTTVSRLFLVNNKTDSSFWITGDLHGDDSEYLQANWMRYTLKKKKQFS